jgi:hypothetical protein
LQGRNSAYIIKTLFNIVEVYFTRVSGATTRKGY